MKYFEKIKGKYDKSYNLEYNDNPKDEIEKLNIRIKNGDAFIIDAPGMTKKEKKQFTNYAIEQLKNKKTAIKIHAIILDGSIYKIME
jgi:hypothetical protein